jgi:hypothetical protein
MAGIIESAAASSEVAKNGLEGVKAVRPDFVDLTIGWEMSLN